MKRLFAFVCIALLASTTARAEIVVKEIDYKAGDVDMAGYVAYDDATTDKRPGVLVLPEWWGTTDYPKSRAKQLAQLGYVAFAADMFGKGKITDDAKQAGEWAGQVKGSGKLARERVDAAFNVLKQQPNVDPDKLAAIGYCFGGTLALQMARWNEPVKGVVSFHGDLTPIEPAADKIAPRILVCTGDADAFVPPEQVKKFQEEMTKAGAVNSIEHYPNAHHAFTNPDADRHKIDNIKYDADADKKSWEQMVAFLKDVFGK